MSPRTTWGRTTWGRTWGLAALAVAALMSAAAQAQTSYPSRPIRMIVPQASGSASDTVARIIAAELTTRLKQQVIVDNRPGGALQLGLELTAKAPPDGYTIGYAMIGALAISPNMLQKPPIDVGAGNCAIGLCIDFYGRQQQEAVRRRDRSERVGYVAPAGGSVASRTVEMLASWPVGTVNGNDRVTPPL